MSSSSMSSSENHLVIQLTEVGATEVPFSDVYWVFASGAILDRAVKGPIREFLPIQLDFNNWGGVLQHIAKRTSINLIGKGPNELYS